MPRQTTATQVCVTTVHPFSKLLKGSPDITDGRQFKTQCPGRLYCHGDRKEFYKNVTKLKSCRRGQTNGHDNTNLFSRTK